MLTREHGIVVYERGKALPDRIGGADLIRYGDHAQTMLNVYRLGLGQTRQELHRSIHNLLSQEPDCPTRRLDAFCKLLDDAGAYDTDRARQAADLRRKVFRLAALRHPLVRSADRLFENEEAPVKAGIAAELGVPWEEIDRRLFADVMEFHRLKIAPDFPDGAALVDRYNVAQVQVALFDAVQMTVWASDDFKTILRYAKLARLMHTIRRVGEARYEVTFDGPASVLRETRRYGVNMAKFVPALLACDGWRMHALLQTRRRAFYNRLELSPADGLRSHLPPPDEFDSSVESGFAAKWGDEKRDGWALLREGEILHKEQRVFVPDFTFRHEDGRSVPMEIVGFWTPEYLKKKLETLAHFSDRPILLAVGSGAGKGAPDLGPGTIQFKTALKLNDVLERLASGSA
jgi:predicted nuclease of restriction endonuclease-like RecB superfamily